MIKPAFCPTGLCDCPECEFYIENQCQYYDDEEEDDEFLEEE